MSETHLALSLHEQWGRSDGKATWIKIIPIVPPNKGNSSIIIVNSLQARHTTSVLK